MEMDHSGICFLCLRNTELDLNCSPQNTNPGPVKQSFSLRHITRFLEIDVGEILNVSEIQRQPDQLFNEDETDVKVSVCEDCSLMTERFNNLYQTLELTKIRISQCLERIYDLMLAAEKDSNRLDTSAASSRSCDYEEIMVNMKALRRATIDKCTKRLKNLPDNDLQVPEETFNDVDVKVDVEVEVSEPFLASSTIDDIKPDDLSNVKIEEAKDSDTNACQSLATLSPYVVTEEPRYPCLYCNAVFSTNRQNKRHMVTFHFETFFSNFDEASSICKNQFRKMIVHLLFHDLVEEDQLSCRYCEETYENIRVKSRGAASLKMHLIEAHYNNLVVKLKKILENPSLPDILTSIEDYGRTCEFCGVYFPKSILKLHSSKYCKAVKVPTNEMIALQHPTPTPSWMDFDHMKTTPTPKVSEPPPSVEVIDLSSDSDSGSLLEEPLVSNATTNFENGLGDREEVSTSQTTCLDSDCHSKTPSCKYCKGSSFRDSAILNMHMFSYHCETFFPNEQHFRYSKNQFRMIIYHLLFKDLNIFFARKLNVFSCVHCETRINTHSYNKKLKLHLLKYHHELLVRKLLEIQEAPDLNAQLEAACWDKGTCENCKTYHPNKMTLDIHQKKYCPAANDSMRLWKVKVDLQRRQGQRKYTTCEKCGKVLTKSSLFNHKREFCKVIKRQKNVEKLNCVQRQIPMIKQKFTCEKCGKEMRRGSLFYHRKFYCKGIKRLATLTKGNCVLPTTDLGEQVATQNDLAVISEKNDVQSVDFDHMNSKLKPYVSDPLASAEMIDLSSDSGSLLEEPLNSNANTDFENGLGDIEEASSSQTTYLDSDSHLKKLRCKYCKVGSSFKTSYVLNMHMFSYHCETFFPTEQHFRYSKNQFRMIIYHLLFKDLNNFFGKKHNVFSCIYCKKTIVTHSYNTKLKLHLLNCHHELVVRKLRKIQEAPDLNAQLEAACWDKGTCEYCNTYYPNKITLDIHQKKYCPAASDSMRLWKVKVDLQRRQGRRKYTTCEKCGKVMTKGSVEFHKKHYCKGNKTQTNLEIVNCVQRRMAMAKQNLGACDWCGVAMTKRNLNRHRNRHCKGFKTHEVNCAQHAIDNDLAVAGPSPSSIPNSSSTPLYLPPNTMVKCAACGKSQLLSDFMKQKGCSCLGMSLDMLNFSLVSSSSPLPIMSSEVPNSETIDVSSASTTLTFSSSNAMREESLEVETIDISSEDLTLVSSSTMAQEPEILTMGIDGNTVSYCDDDVIEVDPLG